jgi:L-threonylcarbamoyladenylate synthase
MVDFSDDIEQCLEVLHKGGVILYCTDTIWGLGCDAANTSAVRKLIQIKGKPEKKGLIVLLATERDVLKYVADPDPEVFNFLAGTTKPTTIIYADGLNVADEILNEDGSIAIRLVKEDFCRHLLKRFKKPIVSTSANFHGQPSPQNFKSISINIKDSVDYVVSFRRNEEGSGLPSALIKWENGRAFVIRN